MSVVRSHMSLQVDSDPFYSGWVEGLTDTQELLRFDIHSYPSEAGLTEIVRNLCELAQEGGLTDATLGHDLGLIAGWLLRFNVGVEI